MGVGDFGAGVGHGVVEGVADQGLVVLDGGAEFLGLADAAVSGPGDPPASSAGLPQYLSHKRGIAVVNRPRFLAALLLAAPGGALG